MKINTQKTPSFLITILAFALTIVTINNVNSQCQIIPNVDEVNDKKIPKEIKGILESKNGLIIHQLYNSEKEHEYKVIFLTDNKVNSIFFDSSKKSGRRGCINFKVEYEHNSKSDTLYLVSFKFKTKNLNGKISKFIRKRNKKRIIEINVNHIKYRKNKDEIITTQRTGIATTTNEVPEDPDKFNHKQ